MELGKLRVNQLSPEGWDWYQQYLAALDAYDIERYSSFLSPTSRSSSTTTTSMQGVEVAKKGLAEFWASVSTMGFALVHEPLNIYGDDRRFVLEALNHYDTADGRRITVRATAWTDRGDDGKVTSVRLYQDLSTLYGSTG